ncbi:MAG: nitroreductase family protein [Sulfurospirillaceae bacterium]|nr:nitroreductase family protein [Sulfurospirillaceae bacterium]
MQYHALTMHSYRSVRMHTHFMDWEHQPKAFKIYPSHYRRIPLEKSNALHRFIILIGGITAQKSYPGMTYALRTNPSAGALYPTEVYVQIRDVEGFENGIYHVNPYESALVLLYPLNVDEGVESALGLKCVEGFIFLFSALYYRSSWKYRDRAFRYCLNDTGHMLGALEASCYVSEREYRIVYDGDKGMLSRAFGFGSEEMYLSSAIVGIESEFLCQTLHMQLPNVDGTGTFEQNRLIEESYRQTLHLQQKVQKENAVFNVDKEALLQAIWKRRSVREFSTASMRAEDFQTILAFITQPIPSDVDETVEIFAVINKVEGMWQGLWKDGVYLKSGNFAQKSGYLCLEQALGAFSGVTFFLVGYSEQNYQAMMQKAGIIGHRLYLISECLGLGCSGIGAYYDEEVAEFLDTKGMILYALAVGK